MKRTAVIIFTIAILGIVGIVDKSQAKSHQLVSPALTGAATASNMSSGSTPGGMSRSAGMPGSGSMTRYKDGTYTGNSEFTPYGAVQISVVVNSGKISDVNFLQMPNDQFSSQQRTQYSEPLLKQTTLNHQSANIDFVSGATATSEAYQQSLQSALDLATRA